MDRLGTVNDLHAFRVVRQRVNGKAKLIVRRKITPDRHSLIGALPRRVRVKLIALRIEAHHVRQVTHPEHFAEHARRVRLPVPLHQREVTLEPRAARGLGIISVVHDCNVRHHADAPASSVQFRLWVLMNDSKEPNPAITAEQPTRHVRFDRSRRLGRVVVLGYCERIVDRRPEIFRQALRPRHDFIVINPEHPIRPQLRQHLIARGIEPLHKRGHNRERLGSVGLGHLPCRAADVLALRPAVHADHDLIGNRSDAVERFAKRFRSRTTDHQDAERLTRSLRAELACVVNLAARRLVFHHSPAHVEATDRRVCVAHSGRGNRDMEVRLRAEKFPQIVVFKMAQVRAEVPLRVHRMLCFAGALDSPIVFPRSPRRRNKEPSARLDVPLKAVDQRDWIGDVLQDFTGVDGIELARPILRAKLRFRHEPAILARILGEVLFCNRD